jgi:hypothetical protein
VRIAPPWAERGKGISAAVATIVDPAVFRRRPASVPRRTRGAGATGAFLLALAVVGIAYAFVGRTGEFGSRSARNSFARLSPAAQATVSRVLGRDDLSYRVRPGGRGFTARNPRERLDAVFTSKGVEVRSGRARLGLYLRAVGYGSNVTPVRPTAPRADANQVVYRRGPLVEWYANGPIGLEQGFTLKVPLPDRRTGPVTLALRLSGTLRSSVALTGDSLDVTGSSLRYGGLTASDARGRQLPAWLELRGRTLLVRVDDTHARYPLTIDPLIQQARLTASDGRAEDGLGTSVAVSGDTLAVGAPNATVGGNSRQGAVYVFVKSTAGWATGTETARLTASDGGAGDSVGASVAVSGDTIVTGADGAVRSSLAPGAVYVFVKPAAGWTSGTETAKLTASDGPPGGHLGRAVAVSGDTVVAAAGRATSDPLGVGAAYLFVKPAAGWVSATETAKLIPSDGRAAFFGTSVAVSAETVAVGADAWPNGLGPGAVYLFVKPAAGWASGTETAKLTAADGRVGDQFGNAVAISGDTIVAGAFAAPCCLTPFQGAAYVFVRPASGWANGAEAAKLTASDGQPGDELGTSVAVSGDTVIAGALLATVGGNTSQVRPTCSSDLLLVGRTAPRRRN